MKRTPQNKNQTKHRSLWDRTWKNSRGKVVIFQAPNIWLLGWVVVTFISLCLPVHRTADVLWWIGSGLLTVWAIIEIRSGVNYFRRALGAFVLLMVLASVLGVGR